MKEVAQKKRKPATVVKRREEQPDKPVESFRGSSWLEKERKASSPCAVQGSSLDSAEPGLVHKSPSLGGRLQEQGQRGSLQDGLDIKKKKKMVMCPDKLFPEEASLNLSCIRQFGYELLSKRIAVFKINKA